MSFEDPYFPSNMFIFVGVSRGYTDYHPRDTPTILSMESLTVNLISIGQRSVHFL